jgi:hypothetical protein
MFPARFLLGTAFAVSAFAADLELRYTALERMIADQMFTQEGKRYVRGNSNARCKYAYLESPKLGADDERLRVTARFSGRSALDVFGACMGMGDSFDLNLTAVPIAKGGAIALQDVKVTTIKDSYYIRKVRAALQQSFQKDFRIEVRDQAKRLLEQPAASARYSQQLDDFALQAVRVTKDALVLVVDFKLVVK